MELINKRITAANLLLLLLLALAAPTYQRTPVIGIISCADQDRDNPESDIKTTYAEFVEAGNAKVIPIPWNIEEEKFKILLESVNGVLFTGGGAFLWDEDEKTGLRTYSAFQKRLNYVVELVKTKKAQGIHYPLWAICQGFEAVGIALTGDLHILDRYIHFGKLSEVYFTPEASTSTMYQHFTQDSFDFLQNNPTMYYYHEYGLNTSVPTLYPAFSADKWTVTGISKDDNGKEFLTAMESKEFPIYMVMYHAERILWEANHRATARHLSGASYATKLMAKSFITEALKNDQKFENEDLLDEILIENFEATDFGIYGFYYLFYKDSLDEKWDAAYNRHNGGGWLIFLLVLVFAAAALFGYSRYKKQPKNIESTYVKLPDNLAIELQQQSGGQRAP